MIVIVDYGMGNLGSIMNMLKKLGALATISSDPAVIKSADKIILPGVGAFDTGMKCLEEKGLIEVLNQKVLAERIPTLGVCLGMQLITKKSEEGVRAGLGWIEAETIRFRFSSAEQKLKVPHMGWNYAQPVRDDALFHNIMEHPKFYFVHSFYVRCERSEDVLAQTTYGEEFCSAVRRGNIMATQFHPEKSHRFGMQLYRNFVEL